MISQQLLHELFDYKDGNFYWKVKPCKNISIVCVYHGSV